MTPLDEIEDRYRRAVRALDRQLWVTLVLASLCMGAVLALATWADNPWLFLLIVPAIAAPVAFQQWCFHYIGRKYGLRRS